ncbi:MAG: carboxypeptidase regulatory-like domain-containing protein [Candidatus Altiarchaeota archaeon]
MNKFKAALGVLLLVCLITASAQTVVSEVELQDGIKVKIDDDNIDVGKDFQIEVTLQDPENDESNADVDVEVYIDDVLVHEGTVEDIDLNEGDDYEFTLKSNNFEVDDEDIWTKNLMDYACGTFTIKVIVSGDVSEEEDTDELEIEGGDLEVTVDPERPSPDEKITVHVEDEDGDELKNINVKVTQLDSDGEWDLSDEYISKYTDSDGDFEFEIEGEAKFDDEPDGIYQIDVYKKEFCKQTFLIEVGDSIQLEGPIPTNPQMGEEFSFRAVNSNGKGVRRVLASLNFDGQIIREYTDSDGYVKFNIDNPGKYELVFSGTGLEEIIKSVNIEARNMPQISLSPKNPKLGEKVELKTTSEGNPLQNAEISLTLPDKTVLLLKTNSQGTTSFVVSAVGKYLVEVGKNGYKTANAVIEVFEQKEELNVQTLPNLPALNEEVTVKTTDGSGNAVSEVKVVVTGAISTYGVTDEEGEYSFRIEKPGSYEITASKDGFSTGTETLNLQGKLTLHLSEKELSAGKEVTVTALDSLGHEVDVLFSVTRKGEVVEKGSGEQLTFTPQTPGEYIIQAQTEGFASAQETLVVKPRPIEILSEFVEGKLEIRVLSLGEEVSGLDLKVTLPEGEVIGLTTGEGGVASVSAIESGLYQISVDNPDFEASEVEIENSEFNYAWLILVVLGLMMLILSVAIAVVYMTYYKKLGGPAKTTRLSKL